MKRDESGAIVEFAAASESIALEAIGIDRERDVGAGETLFIDLSMQLHSRIDSLAQRLQPCIFEYVYFARPDSVMDGQSVYQARRNMGRILAREAPADADLVLGVPDSGIPSAMGFAFESGIPYADGIVKNRYVGRTFIQPEQGMRELGVRTKLNALTRNVRGKRLILIDDSIVRGTTCARIVRLLSRNTQLERYLRAAEQHGIVPITRLSPRYPARLRQTLGQRCPAVLFAKGDLALLSACCISVVGSRELTECGRAFAEAAGRLIARSDYTLCSGGAAGADRAAQAACLKNGGSAVIFPVGRLLDCPAPANVLYLADQGYDLPFSAQRALARNHFIHAMGEKTLVAQCRAGTGGTWDGTTENLRHGWSPVFVNSDGSEGAQALIARGAAPVRTLSSLDDLQPVQLQF